MTHRPTGLRITVQKNMNGERMLFIDLSGNTTTCLDLRYKDSLADWLRKVATRIDFTEGK